MAVRQKEKKNNCSRSWSCSCNQKRYDELQLEEQIREGKKKKKETKHGNAIKVFQRQKFILPLSMAVVFKDKDQSDDRGQSYDKRRDQSVKP